MKGVADVYFKRFTLSVALPYSADEKRFTSDIDDIGGLVEELETNVPGYMKSRTTIGESIYGIETYEFDFNSTEDAERIKKQVERIVKNHLVEV